VHASPAEHEHFARVNAAGELVGAHGNARRLAELSTYACNLADAVGELLALGPCRAIEATYAGGRLVSMRERDGSVVGWKPRSTAQGERAPAAGIQTGR
jgi:hypothetical protein